MDIVDQDGGLGACARSRKGRREEHGTGAEEGASGEAEGRVCHAALIGRKTAFTSATASTPDNAGLVGRRDHRLQGLDDRLDGLVRVIRTVTHVTGIDPG
jgi:hypothetical protein